MRPWPRRGRRAAWWPWPPDKTWRTKSDWRCRSTTASSRPEKRFEILGDAQKILNPKEFEGFRQALDRISPPPKQIGREASATQWRSKEFFVAHAAASAAIVVPAVGRPGHAGRRGPARADGVAAALYDRIGGMAGRMAESALFFREFVRNFHTTGAILPSGRFLAAALARFVANRSPGPKRILEVGPGTGAVTRRIIHKMGRADRLDLVELNGAFVERLEQRFRAEPAFHAVAQRSRVLHCPVEELPPGDSYDVIVSGLPLNNFAVADVERLLAAMTGRLASGGTLSFFEYIAVRPARAGKRPCGTGAAPRHWPGDACGS